MTLISSSLAPDEVRARSVHVQQWRVLVTAPMDGAANMALDEALMARAGDTGEAVLRIYGWSRPTLSLGRNQTAKGRYDLPRALACGIDIVRRPTGGRAVLHDHEVTYSVTAPAGPLGSLHESYATINRLLIMGLQALGVAAREADARGVAPRPGVAPCFTVPVRGEIVVGARKLVGSAQIRENGTLLQHGSILIDDDQAMASTLLLEPTTAPPPTATLRALLGRAPSLEEVADALSAALPSARRLTIDPALDSAAQSASERYRSAEWTWRL